MSVETLRTLWKTFSKYRLHILVLVVLGFVSAILEGLGINAAIPLVGFLLGDGAAPNDAISAVLKGVAGFLHVPFTFTTLLYLILTLFVLRACSTVLFGYVRGWITADFFYNESKDLLRRALRTRWQYFVGAKIGTIQNTLVRDVQSASSLLMSIGQVIESFSGFLMYLLVALNIQPVTTAFTFIGGGVLLIVIRPLLRRIQRTADAMQYTEKDIAQTLAEQAMGMKSIKAAAVEHELFKETNEYMAKRRESQVRITLMKAFGSALFQPFTLIFIVIAFWIAYHSPGFSLVSFGATLYLIQKIFTYLESGQSGLNSVSELLPYAGSIQRFKHQLDEHTEPDDIENKPFAFTKELRGTNLSLSYGDVPVLHDINFVLRPGEMLALIGPSGAGKTSLADVVLRLFDARSGALTVDGVNAHDIPLVQWRSHFAYVSQEPFLFNATIEENIRFFRPSLTKEDIERGARAANIFDFIQSLPEGFDTHVGDRGVTLSGGQRQRIVLARALAGRPSIIVLDEATSNLDTDSERLIQESIRALHGKTAVLVIAHRLSTIEHADEILVLERGTIVEQGSPAELRANPRSYFAKHTSA